MYKCKCGYETDHMFVFLLHLEVCPIGKIIPQIEEKEEEGSIATEKLSNTSEKIRFILPQNL